MSVWPRCWTRRSGDGQPWTARTIHRLLAAMPKQRTRVYIENPTLPLWPDDVTARVEARWAEMEPGCRLPPRAVRRVCQLSRTSSHRHRAAQDGKYSLESPQWGSKPGEPAVYAGPSTATRGRDQRPKVDSTAAPGARVLPRARHRRLISRLWRDAGRGGHHRRVRVQRRSSHAARAATASSHQSLVATMTTEYRGAGLFFGMIIHIPTVAHRTSPPGPVHRGCAPRPDRGCAGALA